MQNSLLWRKLYHSPGNSRPRRNPITMEEYQPPVRRPPASTQFPNKYGYLPDINSPRPGEGALVPLTRKASPGYRPPSELDSDDRVRQLEVRLGVAEKSNRALLEEVLRLQAEVKTTNRRNEDLIREERGSRHNLESAMKINNELITQLSSRIKEAEDKLSEEKTALSSLVNHTKGVEQAVRSSQNELIAKKDVQSGRIIEMRNELDSLLSSKEQLERITLQLSDELRNVKLKQDQQSSDFSSVMNDLKTRSKRLEEESRTQLDALRKTSSVQSQSEHQTTQLRGQVETRLAELRDVLVDLRAKQEAEITDRRGLEQSTTTKIHELQQQLAESNRKREENMHKIDLLLREKEHSAQADRINLNSKVADTVEDVNKRLLSKEIKIREEMQDRYLQLERLVQQEQQQRREYERAAREDSDRKLAVVKHGGEESNAEIRELMKIDRAKLNATLKKLDESISIVEKQTLENKKSFEKVMSAEISQRKQHEHSTAEKLDGVNEKLQLATSSLQQSIGAMTQAMSSNSQKQRQEIRQLMQDHKDSTTRAMTDLDARMNFLKARMNEFEEKLEARVATATHLLSENLREKVEAISMWQDTTQQTIKEMSISLAKLPEEVYAVQEKQTLMKNEMDSRVTAETEKRAQEIATLKQEIEALKQRRDPNPATQQDISNVQASLRKMADSIQTVKTVLGMKIQSEQKLRVSGLEDLQTQINQIKVNAGMGNVYNTRPDYLRHDLDTGLGSWDDPTPQTLTGKDASSRGGEVSTARNESGGQNVSQMGAIPEGGESGRTKTPNTPTNGKSKDSPRRNDTTAQSRNNTPTAQGTTNSPSKSRNATPVNKTPRNATPAGTPAGTPKDRTPAQSRNATPNTGRNKDQNNAATTNQGGETSTSLENV
ncbi:hypothetical protein FSP39_018929 [Pinctada imbricata]|uniref:Uncharacterized protein n=1 Tax=Pinctada imbricata TaxID=66713 RepID=A0AA88XT80_PINIB|nr:hypothetical protein FSP39_018929 [Pinctada imbricata]